MAGNKKTRKPYNPNKRRLHVPMTAARNGLAMELHLSVEALVADPNGETSERMARILMSMANAINYNSTVRIRDRTDPDGMAVKVAMETLQAVQERFQEIGEYRMTDEEITALRSSAGGMDDALKRIPQNVMNHSIVSANHIASRLAA